MLGQDFFAEARLALLPGRKEAETRPALCVAWATDGPATLVMEDGTSLTVGDSVLLLRAQGDWPAAQTLRQAGLRALYVGLDENAPGMPVRALCDAWPQLKRFFARQEQVLIVHDEDALISGVCGLIQGLQMLKAPLRSDALAEMLPYLLLLIAGGAGQTAQIAATGNRHVRKALAYIHAHYMDDLTIARIAGAVGVHAVHLQRLFAAETGQRINGYLTAVRMEKARQMLMHTEEPIAAIARAVGLRTQQYFSRVFRQQTGMTPQAFRNAYNVTCDYSLTWRHYYTQTVDEEAP